MTQAPPRSEPTAEERAADLGRHCAHRGLSLAAAQRLFLQIYVSEALVLSRGSVSGAARIAGAGRSQMQRWLRAAHPDDVMLK